jgi:hypothetical protein
MKRLLILSVVALVASTAGGCRSWSSWCNRGDTCATCITTEPTCEGVRTYSSGGMLLPPQGELLPGPVSN